MIVNDSQALQVAPGQVEILFWAPSFHKMQRKSFHFLSLFFCIISPVGVVGQPVVGRHQQVDRVDLGRLGSRDHDDFRLW